MAIPIAPTFIANPFPSFFIYECLRFIYGYTHLKSRFSLKDFLTLCYQGKSVTITCQIPNNFIKIYVDET